MPKQRNQPARDKSRTFRHLESTPMRRRICHDCRRMTFEATEEGRPVIVDLHPISQTEEVTALVDGRWTYARLAGSLLALRDPCRIAGGLVGQGIYVAHRCQRKV